MRDCVVYKLTATVTVYKSDVESYYEDNDMKYDEGDGEKHRAGFVQKITIKKNTSV